jgi:hypothetical protein
MELQKILENRTHVRDRSYDMMMFKKAKLRIKLVYECYNCVERYNGYVFDGEKMNLIFVMEDLGVLPRGSNYIKSDEERKKIVEELYVKAIKYLNAIL